MRQSQNSFNLAPPFILDSLPGYSLLFDSAGFRVFNKDQQLLRARIYSLDPISLRDVKRSSPNDIDKGFVLQFASNAIGIGESDSCSVRISIQTVREFHNRFKLRCFKIAYRAIESCHDIAKDTLQMQGYFIVLSRDKDHRLLEIPDGLDFFYDQEVTEMSQRLVNSIRLNP